MKEINNGIRILRLMKQIMNIMKQFIKSRYKAFDMTGEQGMLMGVLAHYGQMKIGDLSEELGLPNSTVSGIIDRLERQGFVERIRSMDDRRVVFVNVTTKFKDTLHKEFKEAERQFEELLENATPEELEKIIEGLETFKNVLEKHIDTSIKRK